MRLQGSIFCCIYKPVQFVDVSTSQCILLMCLQASVVC